MSLDGKYGIEQEYTLLCPCLQTPRSRNGELNVCVQFFVDVHQGRWWINAILDRETQSMCLARPVVWVLSDNDHFYLVKWCGIECIEDQRSWWINHLPSSLALINFALISEKYGLKNSSFN